MGFIERLRGRSTVAITRRADLPGHRVIRGDLPGGRVDSTESIHFEEASLDSVDLSGAVFGVFSATASAFEGCDFRNAKLKDGQFGSVGRQTTYVDCHFDGADLRGMWGLGNARFVRCTFDSAKIHDWWGDASDFIDCHFAGKLTMCRFEGRIWDPGWLEPGRLNPPRERNEFRGNDFREAELIDCAFRHGIDISANLWPEGPEYIRLDRLAQRIAYARAVVARWPEGPDRRHAESILRIFSTHGYEEQEELFTLKANVGLEPAVAETWRILAEAPVT